MLNNNDQNNPVDISELLRIDSFQQTQSQGNQEEENKAFIEAHLNIINMVASSIMGGKKLPPGIDFGDLVSWGIEGILKAKKKYNAEKGAQFKTYAQFRIRGEILDNIRKEWGYKAPEKFNKHRKEVTEKIADYVESVVSGDKGDKKEKVSVDKLLSNSMLVYMLSLDDYYADGQGLHVEDSSQDLSQDFLIKEEYQTIWNALDDLDESEKEIVTRFYKENKSQKDIAIELELSRSKVCRLHSKALEKLKKKLEKEYYEPGG